MFTHRALIRRTTTASPVGGPHLPAARGPRAEGRIPARLSALTLGVMAAGQVSAVTINFDDLLPGTVLSNQYAASGATFSANAFSGAGSSSVGVNWATNTDMTVVSLTGGDIGGLGTPLLVSGNVLHSLSGWLNENGDPSIRVTFSTPVTSFSATFAGVTLGADVTLFVFNGATQVATVSGSGVGDLQFQLSYASGTFTSVVMRPGTNNDWVAVDNIVFAPVPEPAAYAMWAVGAAGLLAFRRRQRG